MARQLVTVEPLKVPDLRKPTAMLSWPAWLTTQRDAVAVNLQRIPNGPTGFADVTTLPANLLPNEDQRAAIENHRASLLSCLQQTPETDERYAAETLATVTKMLLTLGGAKASAESTEAKAEAYEMALEDLPSWAVVAVARRWYRGHCGNDKDGRPYDYRFMPDPAALRRLAVSETFRVRNRIAELERVLTAVPYVDCSADLARGEAAMRGFWRNFTAGTLNSLTFEQAIVDGNKPMEPKPAPPKAGLKPIVSDDQLRKAYPPAAEQPAE